VTGDALPDAPIAINPVSRATLLWLIEKAGPAFKGKPDPARNAPRAAQNLHDGAGPDASGILGRLSLAAGAMPPVRLRCMVAGLGRMIGLQGGRLDR
jgi:hypothetical protein